MLDTPLTERSSKPTTPSQGTTASASLATTLLGVLIGAAILGAWAALSWPLDQRPIVRYPQDVAYLLVAAEAISQGQTLHQDQLTPIGSLAFYPVAIGKQLFGTSGAAFNFLVASSALTVFAFTLLVSWRRLSPISAAALMGMNLLAVLIPVNLGDSYGSLSIAMHYNKWCFALLAIAFLASYWPVSRSRWRLDGGILAACLALLFFIKITYFLVAYVAAILALLLPLRDRRPRRMLAVTLLILAAAMAVLPANWPYFLDIYRSGLASDSLGLGPYHILDMIRANYDAVFAVLAAFALLYAVTARTNLGHYPVLAAAIVILGGSFAALSQNAQGGGLPSLIALLIILFEITRREIAATAERRSRRRAIAAAALVLLLYPGAMAFDSYLSFSRYQNAAHRFAEVAGASPDGPLSGILVDPGKRTRSDAWMSLPNAPDVRRAILPGGDIYIRNASGYFHTLLDASHLAKGQVGPKLRVWTADCVNGPALFDQFAPARGWYLWTYSGFSPLPAEELFRDVDAVMIPHYPAELRVRDKMLQAYGEVIASRFVRLARSSYWTLCINSDHPRAALTASAEGPACALQ